jgi:hypothetical protein
VIVLHVTVGSNVIVLIRYCVFLVTQYMRELEV